MHYRGLFYPSDAVKFGPMLGRNGTCGKEAYTGSTCIHRSGDGFLRFGWMQPWLFGIDEG